MTEGTAGDEPAVTIYDLHADSEAKVDVRRLPRLVREGLAMTWAAGRGDLLASVGLQLLSGAGLAAQLLVGQRALAALFGAVQGGESVTPIVPWALAVGAISVLMFFSSALQRERQQILGELVTRHVEGRLIDVASAVNLEAFDTPAFHNRVQRVRMSANQALNLVFGISGLATAAIGVVGVAIALLAIAPILIPMMAAVFVPAWLVASRRGEAFFRFFWRMTPRDRERQYLASVLAERDAAKEVRAFNLASYLRARYQRLYDERLHELRRIANRQLWYSLAANLATGLVLGATLLLVAWLTLSGRVALAQAGVAVAGVALAGSRLAQAGYASGSLSEAALYMDDYVAF